MEHETCDQCGFDGSWYSDVSLIEAIHDLGGQWRALLDSAGDELRTRPAPEVWSALEYAAHTRDITALHVFGVEFALTHDDATLPAINGDEMIAAAASNYAEEDPDDVTTAVTRETGKLAALASDNVNSWHRCLTVGDATNTVRRMLEHALHDSTHHLDDVARGLRELRAAR